MTDPAIDTAAHARLVRETVYGSRKRLAWVLGHAAKNDALLEVGCGTGYMLCRPLAQLGYRIEGIDLDAKSIEYGQELLRAEGMDPGILSCRPLSGVTSRPNVIVVSEVLEHLCDDELSGLLSDIRSHLDPSGRLLVTVPNGYGWFEMEHFLWWKLRVGQLLFRSGFCHFVEKTKTRYLGSEAIDAGPPSTLSDSPHVQRFTMPSIARHLTKGGFDIVEARGSVAVSGPFSNLFFGGVDSLLQANGRWGDRLGRLASGFFVAGRAR